MKKISLFSILVLFLASCAPVQTIIVTATPEATQSATPTSSVGIPNTGGGIPNFDHIVLIVLENRDYTTAMDNTSMPNLDALASKYVLLSNYYAVSHPSLPNYIALMSGSTQNITSDCTNCFVKQASLADEIQVSGRTWKAYLESMPSPCYVGDANPYAQKHNPLIYFDSIRLDANVCDKSIVPLTQLDSDLSTNQLPNFSYIMPNLCNSGHNCSAATADKWMSDLVSRLQASPALGRNSLIAITFDEASSNDTSSCCGLGKGGGKVATVLISPSAKTGFTDTTAYSHYSLLKTFLTAWNLPDLGKTSLATIQPVGAPWSAASSSANPEDISPSGTSASPQKVVETLGCNSSSPSSGTYTTKICLSDPSNGGTLTGDVQVSATVDITGAPGQVKKTLFYLDGTYLLTAFYSPYTFTLPTASWADGTHKLSVEALMKDTFTTQRAYVTVDFKNDIASTPVNSNTFKPSTGNPAQNGQPFVVAAVGDGAGGGSQETKVTDLITSLDPNLFLYLGDVYERGSMAEFSNWYGTSSTFYGQLRAITNPTIGNHDYGTDNASGYFNYWDNIPNYYSYNASGWHFISLNSNGSKVPTSAGSDQYKWLQQDLAKNTLPCTIVYYHHPLFNIGTEGPTPGMADIWKLMAQYKVSIVLNGHDHDYQRWVPLDGDGQPSSNGITEFVVGTGGHGLQSFPQNDNRVAYENNSNPAAFGALFLHLNTSGVNFTYEDIDQTVLDSGVIPCAGSSADINSPTIPTKLTANVMTSSRVDLTWNASNDNTGVAGYEIYRNGNNIATVPAYSVEYSDTTVSPALNYTYSIISFDSVGHHSFASVPVKVNIPGVASNMAFTPVGAVYVSSSNPTANYGKSPFMRINSSPDMHGYLRFTVSGLGGKTIAHARLLIYANNSNKQGIELISVTDTKWSELSMNYGNAPALGKTLASSGGFKAGSWISIDLSDTVTGEGTYNFGITTSSDKPISLASREAGLNAPQLIIDFQ